MENDRLISRSVSVEQTAGDAGDTVLALINHPALPQILVACEKCGGKVLSLSVNSLVFDDLPQTAETGILNIRLYPRESMTEFFNFIDHLRAIARGDGIPFQAGLDVTIGTDDPVEDRKIEIHLNNPDAAQAFYGVVNEIEERVREIESEMAQAA